jgi:hypothetical protein
MNAVIVCLGCGKEKAGSPRSAGRQCYCGEPDCQRARRAAAERQRMATDPDHRATRRHSYQAWCRANPGYWSEYRRRHPAQAERNRLLQRQRNQRRRPAADAASRPVIAKLTSLASLKAPEVPVNGEYWLVPVIAKLTALRVRIVAIPDDCA